MGISLMPSHSSASIQCVKKGPPDSGCVPRSPPCEGQFAESPVVFRGHQVRRRAAVVGQEPLGGLRIVYRPLEQCRQEQERIVAARACGDSSRISGVHVGCPVPNCRYGNTGASCRPGARRRRSTSRRSRRNGPPWPRRHRVDLQSGRAGADALDHVAVQGIADAQDVPRAGRGVPRETSLAVDELRQVDGPAAIAERRLEPAARLRLRESALCRRAAPTRRYRDRSPRSSPVAAG